MKKSYFKSSTKNLLFKIFFSFLLQIIFYIKNCNSKMLFLHHSYFSDWVVERISCVCFGMFWIVHEKSRSRKSEENILNLQMKVSGSVIGFVTLLKGDRCKFLYELEPFGISNCFKIHLDIVKIFVTTKLSYLSWPNLWAHSYLSWTQILFWNDILGMFLKKLKANFAILN